MALAPQGVRSLLPELLFVKHYRVESNGWKDTGNYDDCFPFMHAIYLPSARVRSVRDSLRPWPIVPVTSFSNTPFI